MTDATLYFRPHHFLCTLGFRGAGYSPDFIRNYKAIAEQLRNSTGDQTRIIVTFKTDSICTPCPQRQGNLCAQQVFIETLDARHAAALNLKEGDQLTWKEALRRIGERVDLETFHTICEGCGWKEKGICENALRALRL